MKKLISIVLALIFIGSCKAQDHESLFHPIVLKAKETSLYTDKVEWNLVNKKFIKLIQGKESTEELKDGLQFLINSLGDKHGHIRSAKDHSIFVYYDGPIHEKWKDNREPDFVNSVINAPSEFSFMLLDGGIGYLKIVGIGAGNVKEQADFIRNGLSTLKEKGVDKWIVDLRYNGGGNMEPMISGLAPLIGEGSIGGSVNNRREIFKTYAIENGQFNHWGRIACPMDSKPEIDPSEKVAVLLSRYTVSSGEMVAISFKGRPNTKFLGEATGGYTTGNGYEQITDDLFLIISQDIFMDRNKVIYDERVGVDVPIEFQHHIEFEQDKQIAMAKEWLKTNN